MPIRVADAITPRSWPVLSVPCSEPASQFFRCLVPSRHSLGMRFFGGCFHKWRATTALAFAPSMVASGGSRVEEPQHGLRFHFLLTRCAHGWIRRHSSRIGPFDGCAPTSRRAALASSTELSTSCARRLGERVGDETAKRRLVMRLGSGVQQSLQLQHRTHFRPRA